MLSIAGLQHQPALYPFTLNEHELDQLDNIIERKKPIQKGQTLFKAGDELKSLYAIRSGTIKSYTITEQGDEQITGFHLAGDLVGFDAIGSGHHPSFAQALETSMVCEIPFETLDDLSGKMPNLRQQMMRLMSGEIKGDQDMILLLSKRMPKSVWPPLSITSPAVSRSVASPRVNSV